MACIQQWLVLYIAFQLLHWCIDSENAQFQVNTLSFHRDTLVPHRNTDFSFYSIQRPRSKSFEMDGLFYRVMNYNHPEESSRCTKLLNDLEGECVDDLVSWSLYEWHSSGMGLNYATVCWWWTAVCDLWILLRDPLTSDNVAINGLLLNVASLI